MAPGLLQAKLLIPRRGEPMEDAALAFNNGEIIWLGKQGEIPSLYKSLVATEVPVLLPGLGDAHVHFLKRNT